MDLGYSQGEYAANRLKVVGPALKWSGERRPTAFDDDIEGKVNDLILDSV